MYIVKTTRQFDKEVKIYKKRGYDISKLEVAVSILEKTGTLPQNTDRINYLGIMIIAGNATLKATGF